MTTRKQAIERQRQGIRPPHGVGGAAPRKPYSTENRPRTSSKQSGSRGWYDSPEWKARSKAHLKANPVCVVCGGKATISDHEPPVRPDDRDGVLFGPIQSMCWPCHARKSRIEQGKDGRLSPVKRTSPRIKGCFADGTPRDPDHPWYTDGPDKS